MSVINENERFFKSTRKLSPEEEQRFKVNYIAEKNLRSGHFWIYENKTYGSLRDIETEYGEVPSLYPGLNNNSTNSAAAAAAPPTPSIKSSKKKDYGSEELTEFGEIPGTQVPKGKSVADFLKRTPYKPPEPQIEQIIQPLTRDDVDELDDILSEMKLGGGKKRKSKRKTSKKSRKSRKSKNRKSRKSKKSKRRYK